MGRGYANGKIQYFAQPQTCGKTKANQTVGEWLEKNHVTKENEKFTEKWYELLIKLGTYLHSVNFTVKELEGFQTSMMVLLYLCYDLEKDFYSQFLERIEVIEKIMDEIKK